MTANQAKKFLIERMLEQAKREGIELTQTEIDILWTSNDDQSKYMAIFNKFDEEHKGSLNNEYERKVTRLFNDAFKYDIKDGDKNTIRNEYKAARAALNKGDHCISILLDGDMADYSPKGVFRLICGVLAITLVFVYLIGSIYSGPFIWSLLPAFIARHIPEDRISEIVFIGIFILFGIINISGRPRWVAKQMRIFDFRDWNKG